MSTAWSIPGNWQAVASDPQGRIWACDHERKSHGIVVSREGVVLRRFSIDASPDRIRIGDLVPGGEPELVAIDVWGTDVRAFDATGVSLWRHRASHEEGVDDAILCDIDGDGVDEVLVGYNGFEGIHALKADGSLLWRYDGTGNVWHVAAAPLHGAGFSIVAPSGATRGIVVLGGDGVERSRVAVDVFAYAFAVMAGRQEILVAGENLRTRAPSVAAVRPDGTQVWEANLPLFAAPAEIAWAGDRVAVVDRQGNLAVLDARTGSALAGGGSPDAGARHGRPQIAWADKDGQLLVEATGNGLVAYDVPTPPGSVALVSDTASVSVEAAP
ncbi:MAG: PQQ-binding-like beta-propeller repeat protein [Acidobacteriota bacterium]